MRLQSLTIQGFKSFLQRTTFEFDAGITAIVGPNGSGKSNLADAFRWTMGEQSIRALRGRRTEDVLFAGGRGRPPSGFAEVTLTFDAASPNGHSKIDLPFAEVSVARRAYRTGENEYYLNRERARLRDISDVFGQVGLDLDGFAVVGQGTVDSALSIRASDRRALVEQAAGTGYLQTRLDDSQTKLEQTHQNLARVADLLAELGPRLRTLERQARQARERESIQQEFWSLALRWYAHLLVTPLSNLRDVRAGLDTAQLMVAEAELKLAEHVSILQSIHADIERLEVSTSVALEVLTDERKVSAGLLRQLTTDERTKATLELRRRELSTTIEAQQKSTVADQAELHYLGRRRDDLTGQIGEVETELAGYERDLAEWTHRRRVLDVRRESCARQFAEAERRMATATARLEAMNERQVQLSQTLAKRDIERRTLDREIQTATVEVDARRAATDAAEQICQEVNRRLSEVTEVQNGARERHEREQLVLRRLEQENLRIRGRVEALDSIELSGSGLFPGVRAIVRASAERSDVHLEGIVGIVSRLIVVEKNLELAIEVALGSHAQDIIVERWADAEQAIGYLKSHNLGRATFLPLDVLRLPRPSEVPSAQGIVGIASALVDVEPRLRIVAAFLLGQTLVVEDLAVARRILRLVTGGWQIVTVQGELTRTSGSVTGGAPPSNRGALARYRELRDAKRALNELTTQVAEHSASLDQRKGEVDRARSQLAVVQKELASAEEKRRRASNELADVEGRRRRLLDQSTWQEKESQGSLAESNTLRCRHDEQIQLIDLARTDRQAAESDLRLADEALIQFSNSVNAASALVRGHKADHEHLWERLRSVEADIDRVRSRHLAIEAKIQDATRQQERLDAELTVVDKRLDPTRAALAQSERRVELADVELSKTRQELASRRERRDLMTANRSSIDAAVTAARGEEADAWRRIDQLTTELAGYRQQITLELGPVDEADEPSGQLIVCLPNGSRREQSIEPVPDAETIRDRMASLRSRLRALPSGTENLG